MVCSRVYKTADERNFYHYEKKTNVIKMIHRGNIKSCPLPLSDIEQLLIWLSIGIKSIQILPGYFNPEKY